MPIDFWASFEPCESAIGTRSSSCRRRAPRWTTVGRILRTIQVMRHISTNAATNPTSGETTSGTSTLSTSVPQWNALAPAWATTAPASPPTRACEELDGIPYHQVIRFQAEAPRSAASTTAWVTSAGSANPVAMVVRDRGAGDGAHEVEDAGDEHRRADGQHAGRDDRGDGVRRIVEAVDVVEHDRRHDDRDQQANHA